MSILAPLRRAFRAIYIRPPEQIPPEHRQLLLLVGAAMLISGYDVNIYGFAARQIQQTFNIAESDIGGIIAIFRLGMIPAIGLAYLADRLGRRNMMMFTLAGAAVATVWTSFSSTLSEFLLAQTLARVFIYTEEIVCIVVIAEEFNERTRGWAIGQLGALGALGAGVAAIVFAFVNVLPNQWRDIYFLGAIPLLWLMWARRSLPETRRFRERNAENPIRPLDSMMRNYPGRMVLVASSSMIYSFAMGATVTLFSAFLQGTHAWLPWQVSVLTLAAGFIAILGNTVAGSSSDRHGRRLVVILSVLVASTSFACFYGWATGPWLALFWTTGLFATMAADILIAGLAAELFPTSHRTLASSIRFAASLLGGLLGLLVERELFLRLHSHGEAIAILALFAPLCLIPVWFLPESSRKSLEEIAAERPEEAKPS